MLLKQDAAQQCDHDILVEAHLVARAGCGLSSCSRLCMVSSRTTCRLLLIMKSAILHSSQVHVTCTFVRQSHYIVTITCSRQQRLGDRLGAWPRSISYAAVHRDLGQGDSQHVCGVQKAPGKQKSTAREVPSMQGLFLLHLVNVTLM